MTPRIGFIGLGIIGSSMAERLLDRGLSVSVWNRTPKKVEPLIARGASRTDSPRDLAAACDVAVTMVTDGDALVEVALRCDGLYAGLVAGKVHCDMSTVDPATSRRLSAESSARGFHFVHAPVLGNRHAAAQGKLLIFAGGPEAARKLARPVFVALAQKLWEWPRPEQGTAAKLACNLLLAGMMELLAESLAFAARAGIDMRTFLGIIDSSALATPMFRRKGEAILSRDFTPSFTLRNMLKDVRIAAAAAQEAGITLPVTQAVRDLFAAASLTPLADRDYSSVIEFLEGKTPSQAAP